MKPLIVLLAALTLSQLTQAQTERNKITVQSDFGYEVNTPFFTAATGDLMLVSVSCHFTYPAACLAGVPVWHDHNINLDHRCHELPGVRKVSLGWQYQFFHCAVGQFQGKEIQIIAPGVWEKATYQMLVQDDTTIP